MNRAEGPETLPATMTGLTGIDTPTAAGTSWTDWTSADTGKTDVTGPTTVQNWVGDEVGVPAAAIVWYVNWDDTVGVGHRTSWPIVGDRPDDICCGDEADACGNAKCPTSFTCCRLSSLSTKPAPPAAAAAGISTPGDDNWPGDITSKAAATAVVEADVDNLAHPSSTQQHHYRHPIPLIVWRRIAQWLFKYHAMFFLGNMAVSTLMAYNL